VAEEVTMPWSQLADLCTANGLLGLRLYAVSSKPTNVLGPILANTAEHLDYQAKLEHDGVMFAAGPLANEDRTEWLGEAPPPAMEVNASSALGIPSMALAAYRNAEHMMASSTPDCGISWNLLAGIGRIESGHANGGATDAHGTVVRPIYGPALDGTLPGNEVIAQSSVGGGVTYARAMGPMQFLPGTWARYASDGDGDGIADPQNLYDSTLAAARYLCSGGLNLRDPSQVMTAILRYNNSIPYARNVLGWAAAYATGVVPIDLPPVTGPAPALGDPHLEHPAGLGPGLPLNIHGLPPTDPLAQAPLIDLGPSPMSPQQPIGPSQSFASEPHGCTVICIGPQDPPPQQKSPAHPNMGPPTLAPPG
jgi:hypothetical protein